MHPYQYVEQNPILYWDPLGMNSEPWEIEGPSEADEATWLEDPNAWCAPGEECVAGETVEIVDSAPVVSEGAWGAASKIGGRYYVQRAGQPWRRVGFNEYLMADSTITSYGTGRGNSHVLGAGRVVNGIAAVTIVTVGVMGGAWAGTAIWGSPSITSLPVNWIAPATGAGGAGLAKAGDIALGIKQSGLADFAQNVGASHCCQWQGLGLYDPAVEGWGAAFTQAVTRTLQGGGRIHFSLDGLKISEALAGPIDEWVGRYTAWELQQVVTNPVLRAATTFYENGVECTAARLAELGLL
jgi:hypothetical protein